MRMFHHLRSRHRTWTFWPAAPRRLPTAPGRAAGRRARPALESLEGRKLLSLSTVPPNAGFPFTAIVDLIAAFPDGVKCQGTGVMVDSFHVLTAGHMLYSSADGGFASQILAAPELCGNSAPFGTAFMTTERLDPIYVNWDNAHPGTPASGNHDIGLVTLNRTIGNSTGWMAYGYDNDAADFALGTIFNTAGYPGPKGGYDGYHMVFSSGPIAGLSPDGAALEYYQSSITTYCGQSGSPVWSYDPSTDPERVVYAIHVAGDNTPNSLNSATRITQDIFNELQGWRAADPVPSSSAQSAYGLLSPSTRLGAAAAMLATPTTPANSPVGWAETVLPMPPVLTQVPGAETALAGMPPVLTQVPSKARAALHHDLALDALQQHDFDLSWVA